MATRVTRTVAQYLADHNDDAAAALNAAVTDVNRESNASYTARQLRRAIGPVLEAAGLDLDADTFADDLRAFVEAASTAAQSLDEAQDDLAFLAGLLTSVGFEFDEDMDDEDMQAQAEAIAGRLDRADDADQYELEASYRDAADAHGFDHGKLMQVLGEAVPELARVTAPDGSVTEQWGIFDENEEFTPLTDYVADWVPALARAADAEPDATATSNTSTAFGQHQAAAPVVTRAGQVPAATAVPAAPRIHVGGTPAATSNTAQGPFASVQAKTASAPVSPFGAAPITRGTGE